VASETSRPQKNNGIQFEAHPGFLSAVLTEIKIKTSLAIQTSNQQSTFQMYVQI